MKGGGGILLGILTPLPGGRHLTWKCAVLVLGLFKYPMINR